MLVHHSAPERKGVFNAKSPSDAQCNAPVVGDFS